jgi:Raf kinase inhibitor-like YbhB/YbcL family protein
MKHGVLFAVVVSLAFSGFFVLAGCDNGGGGNSDTAFKLESSAFGNNQRLADKYCYAGVAGGQNISLPFNWVQPPDNTQSFALIIHDPDGENWIHWAVFNIPAGCNAIDEDASGTNMPAGSVELENEFGTPGYGGPEPPEGSGTHRYISTLYALNTSTINGLSGSKSYDEINAIIAGNIIDKAQITGTYSR